MLAVLVLGVVLAAVALGAIVRLALKRFNVLLPSKKKFLEGVVLALAKSGLTMAQC